MTNQWREIADRGWLWLWECGQSSGWAVAGLQTYCTGPWSPNHDSIDTDTDTDTDPDPDFDFDPDSDPDPDPDPDFDFDFDFGFGFLHLRSQSPHWAESPSVAKKLWAGWLQMPPSFATLAGMI